MASTEHLRAHHNLRSEQKREAVLRAARAMVRSGMQVEWVTLAARAGVSEKFIHDPKHAEHQGAGQRDDRRGVRARRRASDGRGPGDDRLAAGRVAQPPRRAGAQGHRGRLARAQALPLRRPELKSELPFQPGSVLENAERADQRALELEGRVRELEALVDERDREILALRDSLRHTIRDRNTGA